ncbi:MAG: DUF309 domain-containing protein, partial [Cryobacterium sp.]|nr:DUF309 domain-containing protein [Oligoflexia bacterium]
MAGSQTKTACFTGEIPTAHHLDAWETGARLFNAGLYFQAHEIWEFRWRHLRPPDRAQVQAA